MRHLNNRGMALILTLMVVAIITAMVVEFAYGIYVSTSALNNWQTSQRLSLLARSATQLGARLVTERVRQPYTQAVFETTQKAPVGEIDSTMTLRIEDENAKFNLNTLGGSYFGSADPYDDFVRLLKALDLKEDKAKDIADRICYWTFSSTSHRPRDAKSETKNAKLDSLEELLLIPGIDRESYEKLLPYVTIYGNNFININSADIPVIRSLSDKIDRQDAEKLIRYREITPFERPQDIGMVNTRFQLVNQGSLKVIGSSFRIVATGSTGDVKRVIETVVDISGSSRTVRYWKEL